MKIRPLILFPLIALSFSGCASMNERERAVDQLTRQVAELKASVEEKGARLDDLSNKFSLLHEKIEASNAAIGKISTVPDEPPAGLAVVPLNEDGEARARRRYLPAKLERPAEKAPPTSAPALANNAGIAARADTPVTLYNRGQDLFISGRYDEARRAFLALVKDFPGDNLADNALYWVGESYYSEKDYGTALLKFKEAADRYPEGNKAPDALLKVGFTCIEINRPEDAKDALQGLVRKYPDSEAAIKAKKALDKLSGAKKEGSR
ncbi:MAG: tol-pal system protein YbgF [Deltaproteobacteria bacterium]|nr:tol-pal system protein YbgF [Deltaproteobacteria bacterium]